MNPTNRLISPLTTAAAILALLAHSPGASAQQDRLPNLTSTPAFDIHVSGNSADTADLRFSFLSWNSGAGPFELIAGEVAQGRQNVYQRIYDSNGSYREVLAGNFEWHSDHNHFHFDDYAYYLLQSVTGNSQKTGAKTSFCLMDTDRIDGSLPGSPSSAQYVSCGNFFQGISVGYGDKYGWHLAGQEIPLRNLGDGDYRLIATVDPTGVIQETNESDNDSCVLLRLVTSTSPPTVTILDEDGCDSDPEPPPPGNEVVVDSIIPATAAKGSSVSVLISGSGFLPGMTVKLENGRGARPVVSNVQIDEQASTVTALITMKKGAKPTTWDVRVGSGVLVDGFTVTRR